MSGEDYGDYSEVVSVILDNEMQLSYDDGYAIIEPDAGRRVATINRYYIDERNFEEYFPAGYSNDDGGWLIEGFIIEVMREDDGVQPADSRAQALQGGFSIREYELVIMDAYPADR